MPGGCHQHQMPFGHPSPTFAKLHQGASWRQSSTTCSCHSWNPFDHDGMNYCQICHPVKPPNAVP